MDYPVKYHKDLIESGRWFTLPFPEQMANIGSEVARACRWKGKGNEELTEKAFERAWELLNCTMLSSSGPRKRELARCEEVLCDFFVGDNEYQSTPEQMQRYFDIFAGL